MSSRHCIVTSCALAIACSGDPHVVGVGNSGGGSTSSSVVGGSNSIVGGAGGALGSAGSLGLGGAGSPTGGSVAAGAGGAASQTGGTNGTGGSNGTGGVDCACVLGAYVPVCGTNGTTYDAACGDICVPVPIACRHTCPCTSTGGASSVGGSSALVAIGGTAASGGNSSAAAGTSGLCGSGCDVAQTTMQSICTNTQVLLTCTAPYPSNLSTIMSVNGCTDSGLNIVAYCCPTLIETACKSMTI